MELFSRRDRRRRVIWPESQCMSTLAIARYDCPLALDRRTPLGVGLLGCQDNYQYDPYRQTEGRSDGRNQLCEHGAKARNLRLRGT